MRQRSIPLFSILLIVLVLAVFNSCVNFQFLSWDDYRHYVSNPCVYSLSWYNICNLFHQTVNDTYIPLTTFSFNLEYHLFGLSSFVSHLINVLLHLAVVLAIFGFALQLEFSPWESFIASAIFAVHPMHVESVAWVTERKDVLGILFYVLCLKQYWLYLQNDSRKNYCLSFLWGFLSVLTKSMAVSIPWLLLLLDWYYQRQWSKKVLLDKLPFAAVIFPIALITFFKLSPHPNVAHNSILIGLWTFSWYLEKFILPINLLPAYTPVLPVIFSNNTYQWSSAIFVVFICSLFVWRKNRLFVFACLWWAMTIFFFWRFDFADNNIVADRFMYLPSLGFCFLLGRCLSKFKVIAVLVILVLGYLTFYQCYVWMDDLTLWSWTVVHDPKNVLAKEGQSVATYGSRKKIYDYRKLTEAIDKDPSGSQNYLARGEALLQEGDHFLAFSDFNKAVKLDPLSSMAYDMRGQLYLARGENKKARDDYNRAIMLNPKNPLACVQMGVLLRSSHETGQAMAWFDKAIKINPSMGAAYLQRGLLYHDSGKYGDAIKEFTRSILLKNDLKNSYYQRAVNYQALKQMRMAEEDFKKSLKEDPHDITMLNEFGTFYLANRDYDKAMEIFNKTISMYPYNAGAYNNRGIVYLQQKQYGLALKDYTTAISLELYPYHALITRGDIYFAMGERKKALEDYGLACFFSQGDILAQRKRDQLKYILSHATS